MSMLEVRNNALSQNPPSAQEHITTHGSDWYWAVFSVMAFTALLFSVMAMRTPRNNRIFYYITIAILTTAGVSYYTMASNLGSTPVTNEFNRSNHLVAGRNRQIFYVRYIDWVITTPLLLLDILLTAGLTWRQILYTVFVDLVMIITGLVGALVPSRYKWGYFTFAMAALFLVTWQVVWIGFNNAKTLGSDVHKLYLFISWWTIFLWFLYPVAWGLSEGGNVISSDSEAIFYGILDILAKPVFGAVLLWGHRNIDLSRLNLASDNARPENQQINNNVNRKKETNGQGIV